MKSYTSIEQAKKLAEFLPLESADMSYIKDKPNIGFLQKEYKEFGDTILQDYYPCWSLAALFSMLPKSAYLEKGSSTELCRVTLPVELISSDWNLEPIDACVEVILKLHKQKLL